VTEYKGSPELREGTFAIADAQEFLPLDPALKRFRVAEIFGPTIQGEGALAGAVTHFVRFGGCDYRCVWCDSLHAVLPEEVAKLDQLTLQEVWERVLDLRPAEWVTLSGGNPALLNLGPLVTMLQEEGYKIAVETQGSVWKDWLGAVDLLTISPKPPSSRMATPAHEEQADRFVERAFGAMGHDTRRLAIKIVVFDDRDYEWARDFLVRYRAIDGYLSVGTARDPMTLPGTEGERLIETRDGVCDSFAWLAEKVANDRELSSYVRVLPQLHVLAYGHKIGV
jgi:7-carboxy-7-deazaguanine synthase